MILLELKVFNGTGILGIYVISFLYVKEFHYEGIFSEVFNQSLNVNFPECLVNFKSKEYLLLLVLGSSLN